MNTPTPAMLGDLTGMPVAPVSTSQDGVRVYNSKTWMQKSQMVLIEHEGEIFRLQATRLGKLILTK